VRSCLVPGRLYAEAMASPMPSSAAHPMKTSRPSIADVVSLPPQWLSMYEEFITKNAGQVSQIESALRSLTYIIPGENLRTAGLG
jgi:peroxin-16